MRQHTIIDESRKGDVQSLLAAHGVLAGVNGILGERASGLAQVANDGGRVAESITGNVEKSITELEELRGDILGTSANTVGTATTEHTTQGTGHTTEVVLPLGEGWGSADEASRGHNGGDDSRALHIDGCFEGGLFG